MIFPVIFPDLLPGSLFPKKFRQDNFWRSQALGHISALGLFLGSPFFIAVPISLQNLVDRQCDQHDKACDQRNRHHIIKDIFQSEHPGRRLVSLVVAEKLRHIHLHAARGLELLHGKADIRRVLRLGKLRVCRSLPVSHNHDQG